MATRAEPRKGPITVRFIDLPAKLEHDFQVDPNIGFPLFLSALTDVSAALSNHVKGVARPPSSVQGFTTSIGCWWFRVARADGTYMSASREEVNSGAWSVLDTSATFGYMMRELTTSPDTEGGWVEVQHSQQKDRDDEALRQITENFAIVRDTMHVGYKSRIPSFEFPNTQSKTDHKDITEATTHIRTLSDIAEAPIPPSAEVTGLSSVFLQPQSYSEPVTPFGLPSPMSGSHFDIPTSNNAPPASETNSFGATEGSNIHDFSISTASRVAIPTLPTISPSTTYDADSLTAAARYEVKELQVVHPMVVDSSLIYQENNFETSTNVETNPVTASMMFGNLLTQAPYMHGPHSQFGPTNLVPQQNNIRTSGPIRGRLNTQRGRGRGFTNDNNRTTFQNRNPVNVTNRGRGTTSGNQVWRGNRGHYQNRGHMARGSYQQPSSTPVNNALPRAATGSTNPPFRPQFPTVIDRLPPSADFRRPPLSQAIHQSVGSQMAPLTHQLFPFGLNNGQNDWTTVPGVNTDLMTESQIASLNEQRFTQSSEPAVVLNVNFPTSQSGIAGPAIPTIASERFTEEQNELMLVQDIQTALDVTVTNPSLTQEVDNVNEPPQFGTAEYVVPMDIWKK